MHDGAQKGGRSRRGPPGAALAIMEDKAEPNPNSSRRRVDYFYDEGIGNYEYGRHHPMQRTASG